MLFKMSQNAHIQTCGWPLPQFRRTMQGMAEAVVGQCSCHNEDLFGIEVIK